MRTSKRIITNLTKLGFILILMTLISLVVIPIMMGIDISGQFLVLAGLRMAKVFLQNIMMAVGLFAGCQIIFLLLKMKR